MTAKQSFIMNHTNMKQEIPIFKIRPSSATDILGGTIGLTDTQKETLNDRISRENGTHLKKLKLTDPMIKELSILRHKQANPELPQGAKSYVKRWLKEYRWKRYKEIKSKYIRKGNATEQDGFTLMCTVLNLGMVRSKAERFKNHYSTGICDLHLPHLDLIIDNKSSWDWETFPRYEEEIPDKDKRYIDQIQCYMEGYNASEGWVVYTLVDCPIDIIGKEIKWELDPNKKQEIALNLVYTLDYWKEVKDMFFPEADDIEFVEIPEVERVKVFKFKRDFEHAKEVEMRVKMCQDYLEGLLKK